ncbi:MAG: RdgB/HAM1 family non-canonical purine NTP pyrophosphatase [Flavobacteriales bacterium]|nr:RdgB/HAM1 family non-canonical purine NTP pyrophosphatase [Flavobacteriales bacterium]
MAPDPIVLCTNNPGKAAELRTLLPPAIRVLTLADVGIHADLPETGDTLEANALQKARYVHDRCHLPCLADDTGLEVDALNGRPGVHSARYAGPARDAVANMRLLLTEMKGVDDRRARFRTVLALVSGTLERCFAGQVEGRIIEEPRGAGGFGYDPVFVPQGDSLTFAEMPLNAKNAVSHRARALRKFLDHLATVHRAG